MAEAKPSPLLRRLIGYTLHLSVPIKARLLLAITLVCSLFNALSLIPDSTLSDGNSRLNLYMAKYSWGWTLMCLVPTVMFTSFLYTGMRWTMVLKHFARVAVSHVIWFILTTSFVLLDEVVGTCNGNENSGRSECKRDGHMWEGFDISGHIFLLTYCILVLTEETAGIRWEVWSLYEDVWLREHQVVDKMSNNRKEQLLTLHRISTWPVSLLELLAMAEVLLWTVVVTTTSLFFHSILEKLLGFALAFLAWYITYEWLYGRPYVPCKPSEGHLHPAGLLE